MSIGDLGKKVEELISIGRVTEANLQNFRDRLIAQDMRIQSIENRLNEVDRSNTKMEARLENIGENCKSAARDAATITVTSAVGEIRDRVTMIEARSQLQSELRKEQLSS